jgi:chaperonin GroES
MILRPEGYKVLVKPDTAEKLSKGGIIIPDVAREQQQTAATRGELVAIGPDAELHFLDNEGVKIEAKVGNRVIFSRYGGSIVRINREEHRILADKDVLCLIEGDEEEERVAPRVSITDQRDKFTEADYQQQATSHEMSLRQLGSG